MKNTRKNIKHFFLLSTLATGCIYAFNRFIDVTAEIKKLMITNSGHFFEWRYGNIFYTKQGEGSPLLLIHDLSPVSSSIEWSRIIKKLEKNHTVYTIDLLGCGRSDKPNLTYTNYMYVQLITDFVKKVITSKTDIIATGDSCSFSLMAANMDDSIFDKIFVISPTSLEQLATSPSKNNNLIKRLFELPIFGTFFYNLEIHENKISQLFESEYYLKKSLISPKLKDFYYESAHLSHSNGRFLYGSIKGNYTNINIIPALKKIENDVFLIGSRESESMIHVIDSYLKYDENIETAYISNCRKLPQLEEPEKLYEIIQMFY